MTTQDDSELARLDPEPVVCTLKTGLVLEVVRLRTRQFFRLLKILTHGAGPAVMQAGLDFSAQADEFTKRLLTLVVMSIPDAEQETIAFLQSMCQPKGLTEVALGRSKAKLSKQQDEADQALWEKFNTQMHNPELADTVDLITLIVKQEAPELQALGKKLMVLLQTPGLTAKDESPEDIPTPEELARAEKASLPEPSPPPSTSSATSMAGQMSSSSISPSAGSGSASRQPQPAASVSS